MQYTLALFLERNTHIMTNNYSKHFSAKVTPQSQPIPGSNQVQNNAGGYSYQIGCFGQLHRFLILGCEGGSYYASEQKMTLDNATAVLECIKTDGKSTVDTIVEISVSGRAPKNDPAIFALALCASFGDSFTRKYALDNMSKVCRIGTHLFQFAAACDGLRGWGSGLRKAFGRWYTDKSPKDIAYDVTKYVQREGWSHRDILRLSHPRTNIAETRAIFQYIVSKGQECPEYSGTEPTTGLEYLAAVNEVKFYGEQGDVENVCNLIETYGLPREVIPTNMLNEPAVWESLLENMPIHALIRNLAKMTNVGLIVPMSNATQLVCGRLRDTNALKAKRVHPIQLLSAMMTYSRGKGVRGSLSWNPVPVVTGALEDGFYASFGYIEPSNKRTLLALDVSASMTWGEIAGIPGLDPRTASAAMAMVSARVEPVHHILGFSDTLVPLGINARDSLSNTINKIESVRMGGTDCSAPMVWAQKENVNVDTFVVYTDSETWCGAIHPSQALRAYREYSGIDAKLVVVGMVATDISIADPKDRGMLDVVGFDVAAPQVISDFSAGLL